MFKRFLYTIRHPRALLYPNTYSQERFQEYLRSKGVIIGENVKFISPDKCSIDVGRGDYITIGNNCCFSVATILAHDASWCTFFEAFDDVLPDSGGEVVIGNNCFIGYQACILKDTHIGDNVIIGARAVVKGNIPSNTVWAGVPARQIYTLEEYYERKAKLRIDDALYRRDHIRKKYHREPTIEEMGFFAFLFLERSQYNYEKYIGSKEFYGIKNYDELKRKFFNSVPVFSSYDEFLNFKKNIY